MNWKKRGIKVLGTFVTGYSAGLGMLFPLNSVGAWQIDLSSIMLYPLLSGMIVALPSLGKVLIEYGD